MAWRFNLDTGRIVRVGCLDKCRVGLVTSRLHCKSTTKHDDHDWYSHAFQRYVHCNG